MNQEIYELREKIENILLQRVHANKITDHKYLHQTEVLIHAVRYANGDLDKFVSYIKDRLPEEDTKELF